MSTAASTRPVTRSQPDAALGRVRSVPIADPGPLIDRLPSDEVVAWTRGNDGFAAWGEAARFTASGPDRISAAAEWWRRAVAAASIDDQVGGPGSGALAFASFTFDDGPSESVVIVPRVVLARRDGASWLTTIGDAESPDIAGGQPPVVRPVPSGSVRYGDGDV
ncbi:MAG TPA: isochorismate synthase, partial [Actinomycetes bacterium]|nr:isochorismate synthase [Actinomycetes bacterium]